MDDAQRLALDEFFAQAEDVLTDWHGSPDAMNSEPTQHFTAADITALPWPPPMVSLSGAAAAAVAWRQQYITDQLFAAIIQPPDPRRYVIITGI